MKRAAHESDLKLGSAEVPRLPSQAFLGANRGSSFSVNGEQPSIIQKKDSTFGGISLNMESIFNTQQNQRYHRQVQLATAKRKDNAAWVDGAQRHFDSRKNGAAQRLMKPAQAGAAEAPSQERVSKASCADTPPLLIEKGLLKRYQADVPRLQQHHSDDESNLDPNDLDENVAASPKQSFNSGAGSSQCAPLKDWQPRPVDTRAPKSAQNSVVSWKTLASMFFRSPEPKSGLKEPRPPSTSQPYHQNIKHKKKQFAQSVADPSLASQHKGDAPAQGGSGPTHLLESSTMARLGMSRRPSKQLAFSSRRISANVYPRQ